MSENKKRIELDDDMVMEVTGGGCFLRKVDGVYVVQVRDADFNVLASYPVKRAVKTVNTLLQEMYWSFEAGKRDEQMIGYLQSNGYI